MRRRPCLIQLLRRHNAFAAAAVPRERNLRHIQLSRKNPAERVSPIVIPVLKLIKKLEDETPSCIIIPDTQTRLYIVGANRDRENPLACQTLHDVIVTLMAGDAIGWGAAK